MNQAHVASVGALLAAAGLASAQITPVGPFTGPYTEGFETQGGGFNQCLPGRVFNNTADLCDSTGAGALVTTGWSFMCTIYPYNNSGHFTGSAGGPYALTFDNPVNRFGGYFGTNSGTDGAVVTFYDINNGVIGTANLTTDACSWTWNGWECPVPVKSMMFVGNNPWGGGFVDMDDLEYQIGGTGPTGACCMADGSCLIATGSGCTSIGGTYRGDATTCATANCPQPITGACCLDIGCQLRTQAQCTAGAGTYRGDNTTCAAANCPAPTVWLEVGDAGDFMESANITTGNGPLTGIRGALNAGDADMFAIRICSPAGFSASTVGGSNVDTQLFLFSASGMGIASDDNSPAGGSQSTLSSAFTASLPAGVFFIAISQADKDPVDSGGQQLWQDSPTNTERAPDGPGAASPIASWDSSGGAGGAYRITLTGSCFAQAAPATCYANCDSSTQQPCLNVLDFTCFLNAFAASSTYANCDNSTNPPVLNVLDFTCFLNRFAAGCSSC